MVTHAKTNGGKVMSTERLNVVLTEFRVLRDEIHLKLQMFYQIYIIYFAAVGLFYGYVAANKIFDFILAVPIVSLALFFRLIYDQKLINVIDKYIKSRISEEQIPAILDSITPNTPNGLPAVMQWSQYYKGDTRHKGNALGHIIKHLCLSFLSLCL
jgi:hypothetical protein